MSPGVWPLLVIFLTFTQSFADTNVLQSPANAGCACSGDILIFYCTVGDGGATIWSGTAIDCTPNNEIILRHDTFNMGGTLVVCNGGAITGRSVGVNENNYISLLNVTVSNELNNTSVECSLESGMRTSIGESVIQVANIPQEAPTGVKLLNINVRELTFSWTSEELSCLTSNYNITSNCGTCHMATRTTAICSGFHIPSMCTFSIQSMACGQVGRPSHPIIATLKFPNKPQVDIIPVYSADKQILTRFKAVIDQEPSFNITYRISGSVTKYNFSYYSDVAMTFTSFPSCVESVCKYMVDVLPSLCFSSTDVNVSLSASNILGHGPSTHPITIGCTNQFVQLEYSSNQSVIICKFLDQMDTSIKSCSVVYGQCNQALVYNSQGNSTVDVPTNFIALNIDPSVLECYAVTASSDRFTVIIEGRRVNAETNSNNVLVVTIICILLGVIIIGMVAVTIPVLVLIKVQKAKRRRQFTVSEQAERNQYKSEHKEVEFQSVHQNKKIEGNMEQLDLKQVSKDRFQVYIVDNDCELKEFVKEKLRLTFKRGYVFYESKDKLESISEHKELIFMNQATNELFSSDVNTLKADRKGRRLASGKHLNLIMFVQSTGSGVRHLEARTRILYEVQDHAQTVPEASLKQISSTHFTHEKVASKMTIKDFCDQYKLQTNQSNIYLELKMYPSTLPVLDVILMDKNNCSLHSGPFAREIVQKDHNDCDDHDKWIVFVSRKFEESLELQPDTHVLYQNPVSTSEEFDVLTVNEDNVRMCTFVESNKHKFEYGCVFYEFCKEEDLQYYKEVVHMSLQDDKEQFKSGAELFYAIPGVPGKAVQPPKLPPGVRVFIQSTSHGSRCLKRGATVLVKNKHEASLTSSLKQIFHYSAKQNTDSPLGIQKTEAGKR